MNQGWIKLYRGMLDWEWYDDTNTVRLFIHLLLTSNHEKNLWHGIEIGVGETLIGRKSLAKTLGMSEQSIRTSLAKLKSTNEITIKSTNKYSIILIDKWKKYQLKSTSKPTSTATNEQPAINQQSTTLKEVKNVRTKELSKDRGNHGNPDVNSFLEAFKKEFDLNVLDGTLAENRKYAWLVITKCKSLDVALNVIKAGASDSFYGDKIASVKKLYYHMVEIVQKTRAKQNTSLKLR